MSEAPAQRSSRSRRLPGAARWALCALLTGAALLVGVGAQAQTEAKRKRILVLPTLQWSATASNWQYGSHETSNDLAEVMGGLHFGMTPEDVANHLPDRGTSLHWDDLPQAKEFSEDVRYVWLPMQGAGTLIAPIRSCYGSSSYVVLLFAKKVLFRVSWRLLPDQHCPDPHDAGEDLFAAYLEISPAVAISAHYTSGYADVVDVTDPNAGTLIAQRWQMKGQ